MVQVASGTSAGSIVLYDFASGVLLAVQRFMAGSGAVDSLVSWSSQQSLSSCNLAAVAQGNAGPGSDVGKSVNASSAALDAAGVAQVNVQGKLRGLRRLGRSWACNLSAATHTELHRKQSFMRICPDRSSWILYMFAYHHSQRSCTILL
jgi:hypothetical protein